MVEFSFFTNVLQNMRAWDLQDCLFQWFPLSSIHNSFPSAPFWIPEPPHLKFQCLPRWIRLGLFENRWKPFVNNCTVTMLIVCRWLYRSSKTTRYYIRSNKRSTWASTSSRRIAGSQSWRHFSSRASATRSHLWHCHRWPLELSPRRMRRLCLLLRHPARLHSL